MSSDRADVETVYLYDVYSVTPLIFDISLETKSSLLYPSLLVN